MDLKAFRKAGEDLYHRLHLPTNPVAIKYIKSEDEIPEEAVRPSASGEQWALCQAFTYARKWGWHCAMTEKDNFCVPSSASHFWIKVPPGTLLESQVRQEWHKDRAAEERKFSFLANRDYSGPEGLERINRMRQYIGFICSPLASTIVIPDTVLIYGDGAHITHIIQAICYDYTEPVTSSFDGFGESCLKGGLWPFITGKPQVVIPGMGDREFSGTTEGEIAIGVPAPLLQTVTKQLFLTGGDQNMGYPVKPYLSRDLTPSVMRGFEYLRNIVDEEK